MGSHLCFVSYPLKLDSSGRLDEVLKAILKNVSRQKLIAKSKDNVTFFATLEQSQMQ